MKTLTFLLLVLMLLPGKNYAQDCLGMTLKTGMAFELTHFNAKEKPIGKVNYQVKDVHKEGSSTIMDITCPV